MSLWGLYSQSCGFSVVVFGCELDNKGLKAEELIPSKYGAGEDSCREGNGTPLQYSCLENPKDGGAW